MRRGRRRDQYPQGEFRSTVLHVLGERNQSLRGLETLSGVNRGTLSGVLHGKRPCGREDRAAIMRALGFGAEVQERFLPVVSKSGSEHDRILFDGTLSAHPPLQLGQRLMSRAQFSEAHVVFRGVYDASAATGNILLQAEAAGWLGWFHGELERFDHARQLTRASIGLIERHLGMNADEVICSLSASRKLTSTEETAAEILSRGLRIYSKVLAVRIVHHLEFPWLAEARNTFRQSIRLDELLQRPELAHDLRWRAVVLSAEEGSQVKDVERLLGASREQLPAGSPGEACLIREQGVIRWQKNRLATAADFLWDAKAKLASFGDARALGPTFCILSKIIVQDCGNSRQARRYALLAASLHPYGYVLDHCCDQLAKVPSVERLRDFDELLAGRKPFDIVHDVMTCVAQGSPNSQSRLIERNVARIRAALLPRGN